MCVLGQKNINIIRNKSAHGKQLVIQDTIHIDIHDLIFVLCCGCDHHHRVLGDTWRDMARSSVSHDGRLGLLGCSCRHRHLFVRNHRCFDNSSIVSFWVTTQSFCFNIMLCWVEFKPVLVFHVCEMMLILINSKVYLRERLISV